MNKITLITWAYKRAELTRKVLEHYCKFPFSQIIVVGTDSEKVGEGLNVTYKEFPNFPLGAKWNKAFELTKDSDCEYVLVIGSDDYLCRDTLNFYFNEADETYYRFSDLFFCNEKMTDFYFINDVRNCGAGFLFKKSLLEKCNFKPVPNNIKQGLDRNMFDTLLTNEKGIDLSFLRDGFILLDVKSQDSMNQLEKFQERGLAVHSSQVLPHL